MILGIKLTQKGALSGVYRFRKLMTTLTTYYITYRVFYRGL